MEKPTVRMKKGNSLAHLSPDQTPPPNQAASKAGLSSFSRCRGGPLPCPTPVHPPSTGGAPSCRAAWTLGPAGWHRGCSPPGPGHREPPASQVALCPGPLLQPWHQPPGWVLALQSLFVGS